MAIDVKFQNPGNPYDPDDPDNYLNRDTRAEDSNVVSWIFGGMFAVATLIGLFFANESPLTDPPGIQVTENTTAATRPTLPN